MKILILMPLQEQYTYAGMGIYKAMPQEIKDVTFVMPMYMDYLVQTKLTDDWISAAFDAIVSVRNTYNTAVEHDYDMVVIGNAPAECEFDAVFNFQDIEEELPYVDKFIEKIKELIATSDKADEEEKNSLLAVIGNLHEASESKLSLINCVATADFITSYLKTDPKLDKIKLEYERRLKELNRL